MNFKLRDQITLVVDDGPSEATGELLAVLEKHRHRAVLFVLGCNIEGREAMLIDAIHRGFHLGNHSFRHERFSEIDAREARLSIEMTEKLIESAYDTAGVPRPGRWFRFPYLDSGGARQAEFQSVLREMGFERPAEITAPASEEWDDPSRLDWPTTLNTADWELPTEITIRKRLRATEPGDIVEFHDKPMTVRRYGLAVAEELRALSLRGTVPLSEEPLAVIDAADRYGGGSLFEIWEYRDLLALFTWREIQLRYRHTVLGIIWAMLQPLLIMLVLSVFASGMGVKAGRIPYPLFTICGLVPWMYFTHALTRTTFSLVSQSGVMSEIYFPRLIVPVAAAAGGAMDFLMAALLIPLFMLFYGTPPTFALAALPIFVIMALATAFSMGLLLTVLNVKYKDVGNALPFITQILFFATPIAYSTTSLPRAFRWLAICNPMTGVVEGFRWAVLGGRVDFPIVIPAVMVTSLLYGSIWFFRRQEASFIDHL